jgi:16S rRNA (cytidine1402-2'-O)-methyltransferase
VFAGFPGKKAKDMKKISELRAQVQMPVVFYESPHRIVRTLSALEGLMGPCEVTVCREMTKVHEEVLQGSIPEVRGTLGSRPGVKGELVVILWPGEKSA